MTTQSLRVHQAGQPDRDLATTDASDLLDLLRSGGVDVLRTPCGGEGTCGKCLVRVRTDEAEPRYALACRTPVAAAAEVWLDAVPDVEVQADFRAPAWVGDSGAVGPADAYRIAIDVGTTTIAACLIGPSGAVVARASDRNKQSGFGADVIARISRSAELGVDAVAGVLRGQLAELAAFLLDSAAVPAGRVADYALAGNTVIEHFVACLPPDSIGVAPFEPLSLFGDVRSAAELGLPGSADTRAYLLPAVAGYVGGDITAGALACGLDRPPGVVCLLDLGTNGEIVLATPDGMVACATAAGPAFEGAQLECGMPAVAGAIDRVSVGAGMLRIRTILGAAPIGICGSGLVDALAAALALGLVDDTGRLRSREEVRPALAGYLTPAEEPPRLLLTEDGSVYLSQRDIRQLQLAKGAIAAGLDVVLADAGLTHDDVDAVLLAGGFGTRVRPRSLASIGMLPKALAAKAVAVGNAALAGACAVAGDPVRSDRVARIARDCRYLELSLDARFTSAFMDWIGFDEAPVQELAQAVEAAGGLGFEVVRELDPTTLEPMAEVRAMCASDLCRSYGRNWGCPPACGSIEDFGTQFGGYRTGILVQTVGRLEDQFDYEGMTAAERLHKQRFRKLTGVLARGYPRELPLGVGACDLCPECTYPAQPCRLPGLRTVSMEAAGLLVTAVCERNGAPYHHGPLSVTYTSCVLLD